MLNAKTKGGWRPDGDIILTCEKEKNPVMMYFLTPYYSHNIYFAVLMMIDIKKKCLQTEPK